MKRLIFPGERTVNLKMVEIVISEAKNWRFLNNTKLFFTLLWRRSIVMDPDPAKLKAVWRIRIQINPM